MTFLKENIAKNKQIIEENANHQKELQELQEIDSLATEELRLATESMELTKLELRSTSIQLELIKQTVNEQRQRVIDQESDHALKMIQLNIQLNDLEAPIHDQQATLQTVEDMQNEIKLTQIKNESMMRQIKQLKKVHEEVMKFLYLSLGFFFLKYLFSFR